MSRIITFEAEIEETRIITCTVNDLGITESMWEVLPDNERLYLITDYLSQEDFRLTFEAKKIIND